MRPGDIWKHVSTGIVSVLDRFEDALPASWRRRVSQRLRRTKDEGLIPLSPADVYLADTEIRGRDVFELRRAAALQLHTHAPTDYARLAWSVLPGPTDMAPAQIVFAKRETLERLELASEHCRGFVVAGEASSGVLRTSNQEVQRTTRRVQATLLAAALVAGSLIAASGVANYQTRQLRTLEAARTAALQQANAARAEVNSANDQLAGLPNGPSLADTVTAIDELAVRRPEGWYGVSVSIEDGTMTAVFDLDDNAAPADAFTDAEVDDGTEWTLTPDPAENRMRVSRSFAMEEAGEP